MSKKMVFKIEVYNDKEKQKAMKAVSTIKGLDYLAVDMKEKKLTVHGVVDPVDVSNKLKKYKWNPELVTLGPLKEPEKKTGDEKKDGPKKDDNKEHAKMAELLKNYPYYYYYPQPQYYKNNNAEENPNACVIS